MSRWNISKNVWNNMGFIIKNEYGKYIAHGEKGNVIRVDDEALAEVFDSVGEAVAVCKLHMKKTNGFFVFDTKKKNVRYVAHYGRTCSKRKQWSEIDRRRIYEVADGKCALCGKEIAFEEMTLDHIIPLGNGGTDSIDNLQCSCFACNQFKKNILPEEFQKRISEIFIYQMEKQHGKTLRWKILYRVLIEML